MSDPCGTPAHGSPRPLAAGGSIASQDAFEDAHELQQRGTRQLLLARACFFGCSYLVAAILARRLGPNEYGIYGVIISQLLWIEIVVNAGVPGATSKLIADGRHDPAVVEASSRTLLVGLAFVLLAICWGAAPWASSRMHIPDGGLLLRIAVIDLPFAAMYAAYDGILSGRRRFGLLALALILSGVSKLAGVLVLVRVGLSLERVLVVTVFSTLVVCAALAARYRSARFQPRLRTIRELASLAAPMALYLIAGQVLVNLDLWLLKALWTGDGEVVGQYVASVNLARMLTVIPAVQAGVLFASVAWAMTSRDGLRARRHIEDAVRFAVIISTAAVVILSLDGSELLTVLFSGRYADGERFLWLQLAGFGLFALLDAYAHALMAAGRQWSVAVSLLAVVPVTSLGCYILIPAIGPVGGAVSLLLGVAAGTVVTGGLVYRQFGSVTRPLTLIRVGAAAAAVAMASTAIEVSGPLVLVKVAFLSGLYILILHALGETTRSDFMLWAKARPAAAQPAGHERTVL